MPRYEVEVDEVTRLISQVARDFVLPKFNGLRHDEIHHKPTAGHVDDIVTDVDRRAELALTSGLTAVLPSASVLAEEAAHNDPSQLDLVRGDGPLWIVDPLDGTSNFAAGHDGFGIMVALAIGGEARYAWVHLPARGEMFVAESGSGVVFNGARLTVPRPIAGIPRGALFVRYMPPALRESVVTRLDGRIEATVHTGAAAIEYTDIARGRKEFAVYYRLLPWDHAAPALIVREAGGSVEHMDGHPYSVRSVHQLTVVARGPDLAARLRGWLAR
jgi:fructose-1,6-bisphosphatase/inositol monophosphatase family enzyme